jgi:hypothetical protein
MAAAALIADFARMRARPDAARAASAIHDKGEEDHDESGWLSSMPPLARNCSSQWM